MIKAGKKKARLKDVAELAGVAMNTASTILNRRPNSWASDETKARVFEAARSLRYRPNPAALALQSGAFKTIGLLVADLLNPYFTQFASLLSAEVEKRGYRLLIESWRNDLQREKALLEDLTHQNVDGVAVFVSDVDEHSDFFEVQRKLRFPMVAYVMPGTGSSPSVDTVMPDFEPGLRQAAGFLYGMGHRRFAFLAARSEGQRVGMRPELFQRIVGEWDDCSVDVVDCGPSLAQARDVGMSILGGPNPVTAVVSLNDLTAVGVMRAARELNLRIPEDLSVVGIDGVSLGEHLTVALSTIVQPQEDMVAKTAEMLISRIEGDGDEPPEAAQFLTRFVQRESVGPAPSVGLSLARDVREGSPDSR